MNQNTQHQKPEHQNAEHQHTPHQHTQNGPTVAPDLPTRTLLTAEQEVALARAIEAGVLARAALDGSFPCDAEPDDLIAIAEEGDRARTTLWEANFGLVGLLAGRASRRHGLELDDLMSEAHLGLAEAIMRWDHTRGTRFSTTAWIWISNRLQRAQKDLFLRRDELRTPMDETALESTEVPVEAALEAAVGAQAPRWLEELPCSERALLCLLAQPDLSPTQIRLHLGLSRSAFHRLRTRARRLGAEAWLRAA